MGSIIPQRPGRFKGRTAAFFEIVVRWRRGEIPLTHDPASGTLRFTAHTDDDPSGATYLYEITKQPKEQP